MLVYKVIFFPQKGLEIENAIEIKVPKPDGLAIVATIHKSERIGNEQM